MNGNAHSEVMDKSKASDEPITNEIQYGERLLILAVLPRGGTAAENPEYLNCVEHALGLEEWAKSHNSTVIATNDKEGDGSKLQQLLPKADVLVTTPFHPAYVTKELLEKAPKLKLILTAGVGSDHIDLPAAAEHGATVAEMTGSNTDSVAEDEIMRCLILLRGYNQAHEQAASGGWDVCAATKDSYDFKHRVVGTVGGGNIGVEFMRRVQKGWEANELIYYGRHEKQPMTEMGITFESDLDKFLGKCDVVVVNVPLSDKTRHMFNDETIGKMKKGAILINCARGSICDPDAVVRACESGQLKGYSGDVWPRQPAPADHPWRKMPANAMTPHMAGLTIDAQRRYADGTRTCLDRWVSQEPLPEDFYIVREGELASQYS